MLFWLFVIIGLIGVGLIKIGSIDWDSQKHHFLWINNEAFRGTGFYITGISIVLIIINLIIIISSFGGGDAEVAKFHEKREALVYKMKTEACRDEFGLLSKEVIDEVQKWNTDVVYYQNIQDDFWFGIYYPNVYDQFKTIDYESYNRE